jgi:CrcB protein
VKPDRLAFFAAGGGVGAIVRWLVVDVAPHGALDWGVLIVNTLGSLLLGMIAAMALHPERRTNPLVIAAGAGFCGSLTTFSTLAVSVADELRDGSASTGLVRLAVSLATGLVAASVGWHLIDRTAHHDAELLDGP